MYPKYELVLSVFYYPRKHLKKDTKKLLMTCQKRSGSWTGNYLITVDHENLNTKSNGYIGKLRTNFWASEYAVYDNGQNPGIYKGTTRPREHQAAIIYVFRFYDNIKKEWHFFGHKMPRKFEVLISKLNEDGTRIKCIPKIVFY